MKRLSLWLALTVILASNSSIEFRKDVYIKGQEDMTPPVWTESLKSTTSFNGAIFKTIQEVQEFFSKRNLEPRASQDGGLGLMYKLK